MVGVVGSWDGNWPRCRKDGACWGWGPVYRPEDTSGHMIGSLAAPLLEGDVTVGLALQSVMIDRGGHSFEQAKRTLLEEE